MSIWKKLTYLVPSNRRAAERDIQEELESLAEIAGRRELGNLTLAAEDARSELTWLSVERLRQDVRYGLRSMRRDKLFAVLVVSSLALGIGANAAIYSFMDSVLLRPLPVSDPESLVLMKWHGRGYALASSGMTWSTGGSSRDPATGISSSIFPYPALKLFQDRDDVFAAAFCYFVSNRLSVTLRDATDSVMGQYVSGNYFQGMGVAPAAGRLIDVSDDEAGSSTVAVVSHRFSLRRFGDPQAAVGQTIRINDQPFAVIGVTAASFFGAEPGATPDVYLPMHAVSLPLHFAGMRPGMFFDEHYYWIEIMPA